MQRRVERVERWADSLGLRIPPEIAEPLGLAPGSEMNLSDRDDAQVLQSAAATQLKFTDKFTDKFIDKLTDLLAGVSSDKLLAPTGSATKLRTTRRL